MKERALKGQVAVVTGAGRGIGRAVAEHIAAAGAEVFMAARTAEDLGVVQKGIESSGGLSTAVPCDVSEVSQVESLFSLAEQRGPVNILVCAAGVLNKLSLFPEDLRQKAYKRWWTLVRETRHLISHAA